MMTRQGESAGIACFCKTHVVVARTLGRAHELPLTRVRHLIPCFINAIGDR
jgi:hypothetical protein